MKKLITKILCLSISLQLGLGTTTLTWASPNVEMKLPTVASPSAFLKAVQDEGESLFGEDGPAYIDNNTGKIYIKHNSTTAEAIQGDEKEASSLNTMARIKAYVPRAKKAQEIYAQFTEAQKEQFKNNNCADCGTNPKYLDPKKALNDEVSEGALCSKNEKDKISKTRKTNPACSWKNEAKFALSNPGAGAKCLTEMVQSLMSSLKSMAKSVWDAGVASKNWARQKIFDQHKAVEKNATSSGLVMSGMSKKDIELAKKDPKAANASITDKIMGGVSWIGEYLINLDVPMYKELMGCAKCGERAAALCKIAGVVGKDIIKNAIILYIGGKVIQGGALMLKASKPFMKGGAKILGGFAEKTLVTRAAVAWGSKTTASIGSRTALNFAIFMESNTGKGVAWLVKKPLQFMDAVDNAMISAVKIPSKIVIRGGKKVAIEARAVAERAGIFKKTPGLAEKGAADEVAGLSTLSDAATTSKTLEVEVSRPATKNMAEAQKRLEKMIESKEMVIGGVDNFKPGKIEIFDPATEKVSSIDGSNFKPRKIEIFDPATGKVSSIDTVLITDSSGRSYIQPRGPNQRVEIYDPLTNKTSVLREGTPSENTLKFTKLETTNGYEFYLRTPAKSEAMNAKQLSQIENQLKSIRTGNNKQSLRKAFNDVENASKTKFEPVNDKAIRIVNDSPEGSMMAKVSNHDEITNVHAFGENKALISRKDGSVDLVVNGQVVKKLKGSQAADAKMFLGKEELKSTQIAVQEAKDRIVASGGKVETPNASKLDEFNTPPPKDCGTTPISITGKGL